MANCRGFILVEKAQIDWQDEDAPDDGRHEDGNCIPCKFTPERPRSIRRQAIAKTFAKTDPLANTVAGTKHVEEDKAIRDGRQDEQEDADITLRSGLSLTEFQVALD